MQARRPLLSLILLAFATVAFAQQQVTFNQQAYAAPSNTNVQVAVDLNNDGATDIVTDGGSVGSVNVLLANGDGSFQPARAYSVTYTVRGIAAGDLDGDGNADIAVSVFDNVHGAFKGIAVLYGKGDGTFSAPVYFASKDIIPENLVIADFTGDGKKDVLVTGGFTGDGNFYSRLYTNTGNRTFSFGGGMLIDNCDSCPDPFTTDVQVGDFDGDGHADIFVNTPDSPHGPNTSNTLRIFYGDGAGHFVAGPTESFDGSVTHRAIDLAGKGQTDIVGVYTFTDDSGNATSSINAIFGNTGRKMNSGTLLTFNGSGTGLEAADFNGDGTIDLAFFGNDGNGNLGTWFALQQGGAFTLQRTAFQVRPNLVGDFNRDGRPDLAQNGGPPLEVLINNTQGNFNFCAAPAHGISACSPADGSTITINSPNVMFSVGAADFSPIRKLEVWENGTKLIQQFYGYFDYSFLNASRTFSTGKHTVTLVATGYDHAQMKKDVTFTVGSSSGCSTPSSGIHVCDPVDGSAVSAPSNVHAIASGVTGTAQMQVWVDGVKKASQSGSHLDVHFTLGTKGKRQITFYSLNSAGTRTAQKTLTMTVQ